METEYIPSKFVRKTLLPNEQVLREGHFPAPYTLIAFAFFAGFFLSGILLHKGLLQYGRIYTLIPVHFGFFSGLAIFLSMMLKKWTTEIILTNVRLIYRTGFIAVKVREIDIEQLASHDVRQSITGRVFDYGRLHIRCIEASDVFLPAIDKPYEFRNALEKQKQEYREKYMKVERLRRHGPDDQEEQRNEALAEAS